MQRPQHEVIALINRFFFGPFSLCPTVALPLVQTIFFLRFSSQT